MHGLIITHCESTGENDTGENEHNNGSPFEDCDHLSDEVLSPESGHDRHCHQIQSCNGKNILRESLSLQARIRDIKEVVKANRKALGIF